MRYLAVAIMGAGIFYAGTVNAGLIVRGQDSLGNNLIYDDDLNITWYDFTNVGSSQSAQLNWASNLVVDFQGSLLTNWRLPQTVDEEILHVTGLETVTGLTSFGFNNTASELGHLYTSELGQLSQFDVNGNAVDINLVTSSDTGPFQKLIVDGTGVYWSETTHQFVFNGLDPGTLAWQFNFWIGKQQVESISGTSRLAIAVMAGDVLPAAAIPEPSTLLLLGTGLAGLFRVRKRSKSKAI